MRKTVLKSLTERPNARVHIGAPIKLEKIEGIERFRALLEKRAGGQRLQSEELREFSKTKDDLERQSQAIIDHLAALLTPKERTPGA